MQGIQNACEVAGDRRAEHLSLLKELVSIPSISTDPERATDVARAAAWIAERLREYGAEDVRLLSTPRHPIVWAEFSASTTDAPTADAPTVLIYGHYDVQPVDPIELWNTDPFVPTERDGRLYARGASDMKAQVMACIMAVRTAVECGTLGANVRFLLEGEEEIGSPNLAAAIERHADLFRADVCLNPDTGMIDATLPSIRYGLRGLAYFDVTVRGPSHDLHSGAFGGVVHNPLQALCELIAGMHNSDGSVALPGFYDRVRTIDDAERARASAVPFTDNDVKALSGVPELWGEAAYTPVERIGARPTLEVNGVWGGYTGEGSKTVIPAEAHAKLSMRLVPDQRHEDAAGYLSVYLETHAPSTIEWELSQLAGGPAYICDPDSRFHIAFAAALEAVWGRPPVLSRNGGSVPVAGDLERLLGMPSILTGFALADDRIHSPNESQDIENWYRGIDALIRYLGAPG
ncbi:MAG: dipeptidase [Spirochaetaceae bacterium]|nr:MAG: dipeptidase [Spirochaetaceae bacterium]